LEVITYFGEGFDCNSYLIVNKKDAILIDCSVSPEKLKSDLDRLGTTLCKIILTHGHFDHILTLDAVRAATGADVLVHENDAEMLTDPYKNGYAHFFSDEFCVQPADSTFSDTYKMFGISSHNPYIEEDHGESRGIITLIPIHTPGHSKGSMCFRCGDMLFTGDTLFANNIGRSDLYGGDGATLYRSLKKLSTLRPFEDSGVITIYPGHGPISTLEREIKHNYYIRDALAFE